MKSVRQALKDLGIIDLWDVVNKSNLTSERISKNQDTKRKPLGAKEKKAKRKQAKASRRINWHWNPRSSRRKKRKR